MQTSSTKHCRYNINYHLVFCPKYRRQIFTDSRDEMLKIWFEEFCNSYGYSLLAQEVMPDHVHLFVSVPPKTDPSTVVGRLKSLTAVRMFKTYPNLKENHFWNSGLWSRGYYVGTAGTVTAETVKKYIAEQKDV